MKKIALTGATSMIGLALIEQCIKNNVEVIAIVREGSKKIDYLPDSQLISLVEVNLSNVSDYQPKSNLNCDVFYHFAWGSTDRKGRKNPEVQMKNIGYTLNAVRLAHELGCKTFIGAGSQAEYGKSMSLISPTTVTNPDTAYGIAKYAAGKFSRLLSKDLNIQHIWARIFSVYGPHDNNDTMVMYSINNILKRKRPSYTKSEQLWNYLYCKDAGDAFFQLGIYGKSGATYCVGGDETRPLKDYIYAIRDQIYPDAELGIGDIEYADNQIISLNVDIGDLRRDTGFIPKYSFEKGISETIEWVKKNQ